MIDLINKVVEWHEDRNLIDGATDKDQVLKLIQEVGELSDSVCCQMDIKDDIDIQFFFTPIPIVHKNGKFRTHELTFMDGWKYKRRYNFKQFRRYMRINCPVPRDHRL